MFFRFTWLVAVLVALAACGAPSDPPPSSDAPVSGGVAVIALEADPGTLNPVRASTAQAARVFGLLQPGLVRLDPDTSAWVPGLAKTWSFAADSTAVTLALDASLRWSDGEAFTARDVVATFDLYRDEAVAYPRRSRLAPIASVTAVDDTTVRFDYASRPADPLIAIAHDVLPAHLVETFDRADPASWPIGRAPVTLGAFRLVEWATNDRLVLERNPFHPDPPARLEGIEIVVVPDAASRLLQLRTGEVDLVASVGKAKLEALREDPAIEIVPVEGRSVAFLQFDLEDPRLADERVRRAISHAIDRADICERVFFGHARPAASLVPPVSWAHAGELAPIVHDPARANALLDEAGWARDGDGIRTRDGEPLRLDLLSVAGDPERENVVVLLQTQLRAVGIDVRPQGREMRTLIRTLQTEDFDLALLQLSGPVDADVRPFLTSTGPFNFGGWSDEEFDRLANDAATLASRARARAAARRVQEIVARRQPIAPLYHPSTLVAHRVRLRAVAPTWISPFDDAASWWIDPSAAR